MLLRKIIGTVIILLNVAGLGFLFYLLIMMLKNKFLGTTTSKNLPEQESSDPAQKGKPKKIKEKDIIPDEEDLLKDMDLSDLDNLNLDDFD